MDSNITEFTTVPQKGLTGDMHSILVKNEISHWLEEVPFSTFYNSVKEDVIGQDGLKQVCANVYSYLNALLQDSPIRNNMIISAPSGSGKTETYRAIQKYFSKAVPSLSVYIYDMSSVTANGFKGNDTVSILAPFIKRRDMNPMGIVFLDEFDKKVIPMYDSNGTNVNGDVQASLLSMIEGGEVYTNDRGTIKTDRLMFVGLGSFESFRNRREEKKNPIGINSTWNTEKDNPYLPLTRNDMVDAGASNEIIGRFPYIVNYNKLGIDDIKMVITKTVRNIAQNFNLDSLTVLDSAEEELVQMANSKYGCRLIDAALRETVLEAYTNAIVNHDVKKLSITINKLHDATYTWEPFQRLSEEEKIVRMEEEQNWFEQSMVWDDKPEEYLN